MKTPQKSSKRHGFDLDYSEDSPSKKLRCSGSIDSTINKLETKFASKSYSQDMVLSSQGPLISGKKSKTTKKSFVKSPVKRRSTESNLRITKTKQKNALSVPLKYYFSDKKEKARISDEENQNSEDLQIEHSDSSETADKHKMIIKVEETQTSSDEGENSSNNSTAKSIKFSGTRWNRKDVKNEFEVSKEKKKSEPRIKVEKKRYNTLLSIIKNSSSCSDTDNEDEKNDDTSNVPQSKRSKKNAYDSEFDENITISDEETDELVDKHPIRRSKDNQAFGLEEEAKDVQEMITILEEENRIPRDVLKKLSKIQIKLNHPVPPQHMVETCAGSRGPTKEQKKIIEKLGPIKYGKFTPEEDDIIMKNWRSFCKTHDWDNKDFRPFLYMRHQDIGFLTAFEQRQKFVQYLAHGLPWRTLYSVYWRFRNLCQPHIQSRYTRSEDSLIIAHMKNCSAGNSKNVRKFSELAKILNRTRASVWRRYRLLKKNEEHKSTVEWDLHLVKKFITNLMQITLCQNIRQLKDLDIPQVAWKKLSTKMKISSEKLKRFWLSKLHMQLFCEKPIYLNDIRIKLIEYFYVKGITEWWEIEWPTIAKHFDGMTSIFLAQIFSKLFNDEKLEGMKLGDVVEYGYHSKKPELQEALMDVRLPRICFENGTVKLLDRISNNWLQKQEIADDFSDLVDYKK